MPDADATPPKLRPMHRVWRLLPAQERRLLLAHGSALLAPRPERPPPPGRAGIAVVAGEVRRASGLGEAARLMHHALGTIGVPSWLVDAGIGVPGEPPDLAAPPQGAPPAGVPLVMHVNAPQMPLAMLHLGRAMLRGRRVVGYLGVGAGGAAGELARRAAVRPRGVGADAVRGGRGARAAGAVAAQGDGARRAAPGRRGPAGAARRWTARRSGCPRARW